MNNLNAYRAMWDITTADMDSTTVTVDGDTVTVDGPPIVARAVAMDTLGTAVQYVRLNDDGTRVFARA